MGMASADDSRRQAIVTAITAELDRQAKDGEPRVNIEALANAVEIALDPVAPVSEGKHPAELNANNDG
ncbi:hypothetical protein [Devosia psychrophila]|uniref:Uncharacterized protein n=2 Tax=Devosia psychrophila TaxID=728005 RepID=A0A1I1M8R7_9HYPH|nr:hypothetical protein [Devosia psychrophila]SFC79608.1 hypothetical protein SAMN04488059_11182 [Devosia psychrophila]